MQKKIILYTLESVYGRLVLEQLLQIDTVKIEAVVISKTVYKNSTSMLASINILRISGWYYYNYIIKTSTGLCRWIYPKYKKSVNKLCKENGIQILYSDNVNNEEGLALVKQKKPDIVLSAYFNQIFRNNLLSLVPEAINMHPSKLPYFKGLEPVIQTLIHNNTRVYISAHYMTTKIDQGNIIDQKDFELKEFNSLFKITEFLLLEGLKMLDKYVVDTDYCKNIVQDEEGNYFSWPTKKDIKSFRKLAIKLK